MSVLVVLGHPGKDSLNAAIARRAVQTLDAMGLDPIFHDLQDEGFDPVPPAAELQSDADLPETVAQHCRELADAEGLVVVHPNWWGMPPAVLKGWVDRVFRPGAAYEFLEGDSGEGVPRGLLKMKTALVFNTSNTPAQREREVFGDPLERIWKDCIFGLCGVHDVRRRMFGVVVTSSPEDRRAWLDEVEHMVREAYA